LHSNIGLVGACFAHHYSDETVGKQGVFAIVSYCSQTLFKTGKTQDPPRWI